MIRQFLFQNSLLTLIAAMTLIVGTQIEERFSHQGTKAIASSPTTIAQTPNTPLLHTFKPFPQDPAPESCTGFSVLSNAFSPDSQRVAIGVHTFVQRVCGGGSSRLMTWDLKTGNALHTLIEGSADEALLADEKIRNQEPDSASIVGDIPHDIAFSSDGQILAAAMSDKTIKLWDGKTGKLLRILTGHRYAVRALEITPNNQMLISGSSDKTIRFWDVKTGRVLATLPESQPIQQLKLSPNGRFLVSVTANASYDLDGTMKLWDVQTRRMIRSFPIALNSPIIFSADSQVLVTAMKFNDPEIQLWNTQTGTRRMTFKNHRGRVRSLAVSADSQFLASSSEDKTVKLWNLKTNQIIRTIPEVGDIQSLTFSPNSRFLALEDGQTTQLWNWRLPQRISMIPARDFLGWSPDNQNLVGVIDRNRIGVWRNP